jgi:hypothetical protein
MVKISKRGELHNRWKLANVRLAILLNIYGCHQNRAMLKLEDFVPFHDCSSCSISQSNVSKITNISGTKQMTMAN